MMEQYDKRVKVMQRKIKINSSKINSEKFDENRFERDKLNFQKVYSDAQKSKKLIVKGIRNELIILLK